MPAGPVDCRAWVIGRHAGVGRPRGQSSDRGDGAAGGGDVEPATQPAKTVETQEHSRDQRGHRDPDHRREPRQQQRGHQTTDDEPCPCGGGARVAEVQAQTPRQDEAGDLERVGVQGAGQEDGHRCQPDEHQWAER